MKRMLALAAVLALLLTACGVEITSVGLPVQLRLEKGQTGPLTVEYCAGEDATEEEIAKAAEKLTLVWSSSDETVATVDQTGLVTAVGGGEAEITAAVEDGELSAVCAVRVAVPAEGVTVPKTLDLVVNGEASGALKAAPAPQDATEVAFTYESADPAIATVDEKGTVTAVANGETEITTTLTQTGAEGEPDTVRTGTTRVVVTTKVESLTFDKGEGALTIGNSTTMKVSVLPETASNQTVTWKSSDESVATVDADGKVKAVKAGTATITASIGDVSAEYALTVRDVTCSYCGKTGHTSSSCPTKAADEKAAAQAAQAAQNAGGGTAAPGAPSNPDPAPNPQPGGGGSSGGNFGEQIPGLGDNQVVTGGGNGDGSGEVPPL